MKETEESLRDLLDDIAKKENYINYTIKLENITTGGANYTSVLYYASIRSAGKDNLELFAKVAAIKEDGRSVIPTFIYDNERIFYTDVAVNYRKIEEKCAISEQEKLVIPKYFGHTSKLYEEKLVLENLAAKGFITYDRLKSIDWPYAAGAAETLAKFHALSIAYSEEYPEELVKFQEIFNDRIEPAYEAMSVSLRKFLDLALDKVKGEYRDRLAKFFQSVKNTNLMKLTNTRRKSVLCHGDFRPSNLMHKVNQDGTVQAIPVDFQAVQMSCVVADLYFFIFTSSDEAFRAQYHEELLEHYYRHLRQALRALRLDPDEVYPREDFELEVKEMIPYALFVSVLTMPTITVAEEDSSDIEFDNLFESMLNIRVSPLYSERMNGIINDFVRWGII